ncbi:hypothetical protein DPMN_138135 [Dreissena polymorpha]|uniref:Uncharacterized protein n=1 Tax=Dreissena polymorpha TaxID=45954 RepID=A0A9D4G3Y1_DREPO|nr:hypothetical protein DPMN_138135 [Dreissena polymorpha]
MHIHTIIVSCQIKAQSKPFNSTNCAEWRNEPHVINLSHVGGTTDVPKKIDKGVSACMEKLQTMILGNIMEDENDSDEICTSRNMTDNPENISNDEAGAIIASNVGDQLIDPSQNRIPAD